MKALRKKTLTKVFRRICLYLTIIYTIIILFITSSIFQKCEDQTYNRIKSLKETQVKTLTTQVDHSVQVIGKLDERSIELIATDVSELNKTRGVYCYLYNKDCKLISKYEDSNSNSEEIKIAMELKDQLERGEFTVQEHEGTYGWINTKNPVTGKDFEVYWQGIPTSTDKNDCEYFILLAVSRVQIENIEAMEACKYLTASITILLTFSLYDSISVRIKYVWK